MSLSACSYADSADHQALLTDSAPHYPWLPVLQSAGPAAPEITCQLISGKTNQPSISKLAIMLSEMILEAHSVYPKTTGNRILHCIKCYLKVLYLKQTPFPPNCRTL